MFNDPTGLTSYKLGGKKLAPHFNFDSGYKYNSNEKPTFTDRINYFKWATIGNAAYYLAPGLEDASEQYLHYLDGTGTDRIINYTKAYNEDSVIKSYIDNEVVIMRNFAQNIYNNENKNAFEIIGTLQGIPNGSSENWQKTIGAHYIYGYGNCNIDSKTGYAVMNIEFYMEDMYNFNPGMKDIKTGIPDEANGRFAVLGFAKEFKTKGTMTLTINWNVKNKNIETKMLIGGSNR